jgi:uncharacterized SAM-binding protein YcdF (DUF218 family)
MKRLFRFLRRAAFALSLAFVAGFGVFLAVFPAQAPPAREGDVIVVLTGGDERMASALTYLAEGRGKRLLVSGVADITSRESLRKVATGGNPGLERAFDCCADLDYAAKDTPGNAVEIARWAEAQGARSVIVVTSGYHMPRALLELRAAAPALDLIAAPVAPPQFEDGAWVRDFGAFQTLALEYVKLVAAGIRIGAARLACALGM